MSLPVIPPICLMCEHLVSGFQTDSGYPTCAAFPDRIPREIWEEGYDHRKPFKNESVLFKLVRSHTEADLEEWDEIRMEAIQADILAPLTLIEGEDAEE